ncbi:hypothetical protein AMAG_06152 [Allomyces macrogynus ATCC 38327]|uniref:Uncharacterized protein n=1 Tax=Allomyces macrogynus (strain ATCC 38327) TaxID=578462 RepID=A0A0L0SEH8_ALLM3|nr:hypothetical protein AMAG_06152 [Allomyces macrogynus ATCC 38327]|eukprot:KNE60795.1 hypothetical protein AMAG_06152 [Allomyces macrogynus ATCC 38327]
MSLHAATSDPAAAPYVADLLAHTRAEVAAAMAERERINGSKPVNLYSHLHNFDVPLTAAAAVALVVVLAVVAILLKRRYFRPAAGVRISGVRHSLVTTIPVAALSPDAKVSRPTSLARDVPLGHDGANHAHAHAVAQALLAAGRRTSRTPGFELLPSSVALSPLLEAADDGELPRTVVDLGEEGRPSSASYSDVTAVNSSCAAAARPAPDQVVVKVGWPIPRTSLQPNMTSAAVTHPLLTSPSEASLVSTQDQSTEGSPVTPKTVVKPKAAVAAPKRTTAVPPRLSLLPPLPVTVGRDGRISFLPPGTTARAVPAEPNVVEEAITIDPEPPRSPSPQPRLSDASSVPTLTPQPRPSDVSSIPTLPPQDDDDDQPSPLQAPTAPMFHVDPPISPVSTRLLIRARHPPHTVHDRLPVAPTQGSAQTDPPRGHRAQFPVHHVPVDRLRGRHFPAKRRRPGVLVLRARR